MRDGGRSVTGCGVAIGGGDGGDGSDGVGAGGGGGGGGGCGKTMVDGGRPS